jgi:hypothetical protein
LGRAVREYLLLEPRWKAIVSLAATISTAMTLDLTRLYFRFSPRKPSTIDEFRESFKEQDPGFLMAGNKNELISNACWCRLDPLDGRGRR